MLVRLITLIFFNNIICMQNSATIITRVNINLPTKNFKNTVRCSKCCLTRIPYNAKYKIFSKKKSRFLKRLEKLKGTKHLTAYQLKYLKNMEKHTGQQLIIKCKMCQTTVKESFRKSQGKELDSKTVKLPDIKEKKLKKKNHNERRITQHIGKLNTILNVSHKSTTRSLKDFIKSVT